MPELPHLILPRAEVDMERRKRPGFGKPVGKETAGQTEFIRQAVDDALATHQRTRADHINPALIIRIRTSGVVPEDEWVRAGLTVLGHDAPNAVVLFSNDAELTDFRARLAAYSQGPKGDQKNPSYNLLIASIEEFGPLRPEDRIGSALREEGFERPDTFADDREFVLDVELWDVAKQTERGAEAERLAADLAKRGGEVTDRYIGVTFTALRVAGRGMSCAICSISRSCVSLIFRRSLILMSRRSSIRRSMNFRPSNRRTPMLRSLRSWTPALITRIRCLHRSLSIAWQFRLVWDRTMSMGMALGLAESRRTAMCGTVSKTAVFSQAFASSVARSSMIGATSMIVD